VRHRRLNRIGAVGVAAAAATAARPDRRGFRPAADKSLLSGLQPTPLA